MKNYLKPEDIAQELDVSLMTVYRLIQDGAFLAFPIRKGGGLRIPRESFQRYVRDSVIAYQEENGILPKESFTPLNSL